MGAGTAQASGIWQEHLEEGEVVKRTAAPGQGFRLTAGSIIGIGLFLAQAVWIVGGLVSAKDADGGIGVQLAMVSIPATIGAVIFLAPTFQDRAGRAVTRFAITDRRVLKWIAYRNQNPVDVALTHDTKLTTSAHRNREVSVTVSTPRPNVNGRKSITLNRLTKQDADEAMRALQGVNI